MVFWLIVIVVIILVLAVVLGAVLGTFVGRSTGTSQPSVTEIPAGSTPIPTPTGTDPPKPTSTLHITSLAVTGYSVPGPLGYFITSLFYQGANDFLSLATFNSSTGTWTRVSNFAKARKGSPLAATTLNTDYYTGQVVSNTNLR
jgi:hypothetical protein